MPLVAALVADDVRVFRVRLGSEAGKAAAIVAPFPCANAIPTPFLPPALAHEV
jgi:hypothetical protein